MLTLGQFARDLKPRSLARLDIIIREIKRKNKT
jgi:hypothetical protein